jgi:hypothetical protein
VSFVQKNTLNSSTTVTTQTTTLTSVTSGNLVIAVSSWAINAGLTSVPSLDSTSVTAGWQEAGHAGGVDSSGHPGWTTGVSVYYLQNAPSGTASLKLNYPASTYARTILAEYGGYATSAPVDKIAVNTSAGATTLTVTSATTSQANELVIVGHACAFATSNSNIGLTNPPSGYTSLAVVQDTNTGSGVEFAYKEVTSTGAQSATWSWSGTTEATSIVVTFGTTGAPAAVLSTPTPSGTIATSTTANVGATTDTGSGTMYMVVDTASLTGITKAQIKTGKNASGATAVSSGNVAVTSTGAKTIPGSGLTASTTYNYAVVQNTTAGDSNAVTGSFTTHALPPSITNVTPSPVVDGGSIALTGTNFGASAGTVVLSDGNGGTATQSGLTWANTAVSAAASSLGTNLYGAQTVVATDSTGGASNAFSITFNPPAGWQTVTIGTPNPTAAFRVQATGGGDVASGNQVAWGNVVGSGSVTVNTDGSYTMPPTVSQFTYKVGVAGQGYGSTGTVTVYNLAASNQPIGFWWA